MTMTLSILASKHLNEVQKEFNTYFPYLKIEFFQRMHGVKKASPPQRMYPHNLTISEARTNNTEGYLDLWPDMSVAELEQAFWDKYGLSIQVFRKSGNLWLETTMTDKWTLTQQNSHGQEISSPNTKNEETKDDYELNRGED
ncbi:hypothetical protein [Flavihumibacter profundi]|jgi:hypothetical protein|uniref:hypothetical protein n=1 Tax=Flavihumibacter profundi TaxID=2716883 RepID=UPI001CC501CA|nr:hypothetical protein [Flavihumibacter profundi]MBZ5859504.1 hypothetical protein [Flavihumibacter profundi]